MMGLTWDGEDAAYRDGNVYVVQGGDGLLMFDCGCGDTLPQIEANMAMWDLRLEDVRYCLLTHAHYDHAGGGHLLKERGVEIVAHEETADAVRSGDERCAGYLYHKIFAPFEVHRTVADADQIELAGLTVEVMHLPGHSRGCTAYLFDHRGKRCVVSADVIGTLLAGDFGWSGSIDFDKQAYIESLQRFARVDMDIMLPGHGMVYFHQPRRRVEGVLNAALMEWR